MTVQLRPRPWCAAARLACLAALAGSVGLWGAALPVAAQEPAPQVSDQVFEASARLERARVQSERERIQADFRAQKLFCRQQFFANHCTKEVLTLERESLAVLRRQELALELSERQRRLDLALARSTERQAQTERMAPAESEAQAQARQRQAQQELSEERQRREAEAASRAARQQARELQVQRQLQAREAAERSRAALPPEAAPAATPRP
jgi:colicin import membrane protein